jgi:NAD(P)-dependent dehydrogenase (short-subunit alcohol dehydrogenase family)
VLGATGGIGEQVVRQALDQGHEVTILARDPNKLDVSLHRIRCIEGDVLNPASVEAAIKGNDVVVSALGVPPRQRSGDLIKQCVPIVIEAMRRQRKVMSAIEQCRSAALGGHVLRCSGCAQLEVAYNSCRNRHCPKCQSGLARRRRHCS